MTSRASCRGLGVELKCMYASASEVSVGDVRGCAAYECCESEGAVDPCLCALEDVVQSGDACRMSSTRLALGPFPDAGDPGSGGSSSGMQRPTTSATIAPATIASRSANATWIGGDRALTRASCPARQVWDGRLVRPRRQRLRYRARCQRLPRSRLQTLATLVVVSRETAGVVGWRPPARSSCA